MPRSGESELPWGVAKSARPVAHVSQRRLSQPTCVLRQAYLSQELFAIVELEVLGARAYRAAHDPSERQLLEDRPELLEEVVRDGTAHRLRRLRLESRTHLLRLHRRQGLAAGCPTRSFLLPASPTSYPPRADGGGSSRSSGAPPPHELLLFAPEPLHAHLGDAVARGPRRPPARRGGRRGGPAAPHRRMAIFSGGGLSIRVHAGSFEAGLLGGLTQRGPATKTRGLSGQADVARGEGHALEAVEVELEQMDALEEAEGSALRVDDDDVL